MTLTATWMNSETDHPTVWMASDSRISDAGGTLVDEGAKLFELPIVCRGVGGSGLFDQVQFVTTAGLLCCGATLVFQQVHATLVPVLSNLNLVADRLPTMADVAGMVGRVATLYVRSLGGRRPDSGGIRLIVAGVDPASGLSLAFDLSASLSTEGIIEFVPQPIDFADDQVLFTGTREAVLNAGERLRMFRADPVPGRPYHRAALNVIREFTVDDTYPTVGGDVQVGYTDGRAFRRVATVSPGGSGGATAQRRFNNVDLDELGMVGPCRPGIGAMMCP